MKFKEKWSAKTKIELLQRWNLVQAYAYYELNSNIATDFEYDANAKQLGELVKGHPEDAVVSRYFKFFENFDPECTSSFDLIERIKAEDRALHDIIRYDACLALNGR